MDERCGGLEPSVKLRESKLSAMKTISSSKLDGTVRVTHADSSDEEGIFLFGEEGLICWI